MNDSIKLITSLGFGAVLLLMFTVIFIALNDLRKLNDSMSTLVGETNAKIEAAATMRDAIRLRALSLQAMQLNDDPFFRDAEWIKFHSYAGMYRAARDTLLDTRMDARERALNARLSAMARVAQPFNDRTAELLLADASRAQVQSMVEVASEHQSRILGVLDELVQLEKENAASAAESSARHYDRTRRTVLILAGLALLFSAAISLLVIRHAALKNEKISYQASHDPLTGLFNRRVFESELRARVDSAQRTNARHAVLYIDLDQFKIVNDTCGHMAGDALLCQVTKLFKRALRGGDVVARLGGDEFGVLIPDCPLSAAIRIAADIRGQVEAYRFSWKQRTFSPGVSIGVVPIDAEVSDAARVLSTADLACLYAKQSGRNRVHVAATNDSEITGSLGEMEWISRINNALEEDRFCLFCQSVVSLAGASGDEAQGHMEVLVRMLGPDGELIPPGAFIPAAERYHLMSQIDRWVVARTIAWLEDNTGGSAGQQIMINLSGQSLSDERFAGFVQRLLDTTTVTASQICFEITETAAIANLSRAREFINQLKARGCRFALDDFGSGLSSFAYLKELPVDYLKIDGSFVRDIIDDPIDAAMVKSINDIGHVMGKKTIAEFVENEAIVAMLKTIGVDYAQGFGVAVPRPLVSLEQQPSTCRQSM